MISLICNRTMPAILATTTAMVFGGIIPAALAAIDIRSSSSDIASPIVRPLARAENVAITLVAPIGDIAATSVVRSIL